MNKRILIIEDHADIRRLIRMTLEFEDHDIHEAVNADEGLEAVRTLRPQLLLLDIMMPGSMDGLDLCRLVKSDPSLGKPWVVLLTARGQSQDIEAGMMAGADAYGPVQADPAVAPVLKGGETIGWAFITSDFVSTTGYSVKPIHTLVAVDLDAHVTGVKLVKHSEPIVLIGIPEAKVKAMVEGYIGLDLVAEAQSGGESHDVDIISGATVTVMVLDDSILRSGLKVARSLGLGGLTPDVVSGPTVELNPDATAPAVG